MKASLIIIFLAVTCFQSFGQELSSIAFVPRLSVEYVAGLAYKSKPTINGCSVQPGSGISACTESALIEFIEHHVSYPSYAEQYDFTAECLVKFSVSDQGKSKNISVTNCHKIFSNQIEKVLEKTYWSPATKGGKPYNFQVVLNIDFN